MRPTEIGGLVVLCVCLIVVGFALAEQFKWRRMRLELERDMAENRRDRETTRAQLERARAVSQRALEHASVRLALDSGDVAQAHKRGQS